MFFTRFMSILFCIWYVLCLHRKMTQKRWWRFRTMKFQVSLCEHKRQILILSAEKKLDEFNRFSICRLRNLQDLLKFVFCIIYTYHIPFFVLFLPFFLLSILYSTKFEMWHHQWRNMKCDIVSLLFSYAR